MPFVADKDSNSWANCKVEIAKYVVFLLKRTENRYICPRMKKLYIFNPENDMALASGSPYYMAPASIKKMASDLAMLPVWYADEGSAVLLADDRQVEWLRKECALPLPMEGWVEIPEEKVEVMPWGWNPALLHRLGDDIRARVDVDAIRRLSSRRTAVDLLPKLRMDGTEGESCWLTSVDEVCAFAMKHDKVLLKAPWSGSGKGIQPLCGQLEDNLKGWTRRIIASQGGVVGEPFYQKVKDFAMEFKVSGSGVNFVGYSLFEADARGIYKENVLASDESIGRELSEYVPGALLNVIKERLQTELQWLLKNDYQGYLGVDMMVIRTADGYAVHPCVEVNLRTNMGVVSRLFFERHVWGEVMGRYVIEYFPRPGEAYRFHEEMKEKRPLRLREGKIEAGYLSLTPVFEDTNYQIFVVI